MVVVVGKDRWGEFLESFKWVLESCHGFVRASGGTETVLRDPGIP
jgi:hypothetical protein